MRHSSSGASAASPGPPSSAGRVHVSRTGSIDVMIGGGGAEGPAGPAAGDDGDDDGAGPPSSSATGAYARLLGSGGGGGGALGPPGPSPGPGGPSSSTHMPTISSAATDPDKWRAQQSHARLGRHSIALGTAARLGGTELIPEGPTTSRKAAFAAMDTDGSGTLDYVEFAAALESDPGDHAVRELWQLFDRDNSGYVELREIVRTLRTDEACHDKCGRFSALQPLVAQAKAFIHRRDSVNRVNAMNLTAAHRIDPHMRTTGQSWKDKANAHGGGRRTRVDGGGTLARLWPI